MILIEASNVSSGGGIVLLEYLSKELDRGGLKHKIIAKDFPFFKRNKNFEISSSNLLSNKSKTLKHLVSKYNPKSVLFFGNFPPPVKLKVKTFTFFQNALLLNSKYKCILPIKTNIILGLKMQYLRWKLNNSDKVIVQTNYMKHQFSKTYAYDLDRIIVAPFFDLTKILESQFPKKKNSSFIYVSSGLEHKNHENLLNAWEILYNQKIKPILYLTIGKNYIKLLARINSLQKRGVNIINIGIVSHEEILSVTSNCSFCIYPSLVETVGLGMVEAKLLDMKVICSDLDYVRDIINPSLLFNPLDPISIATTVKKAMTERLTDSELIIENNILKFISIIH